MFTEETITTMQLFASLLMGADYLFNDEQRNKINTKIKSKMQPLQDHIDEKIISYRSYITQQWAYIVIPLLFATLAFLVIRFLPNLTSNVSPWLTSLLAISLLVAFSYGFPRILDIVVAGITPIAIGAPLRLFTWFVIRCPKGSIFGLGFVILMLSFAFRFYNLK